MTLWQRIRNLFFTDNTKKSVETKDEKVLAEAIEEATVTLNKFEEEVVEAKRARGKKGKFLADDPNTPDVNEAWVGGKAPKKKKPKAKVTKIVKKK